MNNKQTAFFIGLGIVVGLTGTAVAQDRAVGAAPSTAQAKSTPTMNGTPVVIAKGARAEIGKLAPNFTLPQIDGPPVKLSQFKGKTVVLEWFNPDCPFVKLAHGEGPLPNIAAAHLKDGAVWLAINSGGPGKQGHGVTRNTAAKAQYKATWPILLDETGAVGRAYGAKRTPHMYVINGDGILVYRGALDSTRGGGYDRGEYTNYLTAALDAVRGNTPIKAADTKAWGCSVKYQSN